MQLPAAGYGTSRFIVMRINACIVTAIMHIYVLFIILTLTFYSQKLTFNSNKNTPTERVYSGVFLKTHFSSSD